MKYPLSITKDEINQFPQYRFSGEIIFIETKEDALMAADKLKHEELLGFDTETRAAFKKGESYNVSLLQLATSTHAYLFRLNRFGLPSQVTSILSNPNILKTGVAIRDDVKGLQKLTPFQDAGFIDLADLAKEKKVQNFGLRALTAIFLEKRLSKGAKVTNWERRELTQAQIAYAACDAVVGYEIYQAMTK